MTEADYEQVYALWLGTPGMGLNNIDDSNDGISKYLARNPSTCFVAEADNELGSVDGVGVGDVDNASSDVGGGACSSVGGGADNDVGIIVGVILSGHDGRRGYIHHTAVAESEQRRGIGAALLDAAMDALKREGITKVALLVFGANEKGNVFWEKHGFTIRPDLIYRNKAIVDLTRIDT